MAVPGRRSKRTWSLALSFGAHAAALAWLLHATAIPAGLGQISSSTSVEIVSLPLPEAIEEKPQPIPAPVPERPNPVLPPQHSLARKPYPQEPPTPGTAAAEPTRAATEQTDISSASVEPQNSPKETAAPATEDSLRVYGEIIWKRILEHKPSGIRLRGTVGLTFSLSRNGELITAEISTASGSEDLDQIALTALREAAPFPLPPETASAQQLTFSIPFRFR